jgi:transcription elongation factor
MSFTLPTNTGSGKGERKRKRTPQRLAPQPFDPIEVKHVHGSDALKQKGDDYYFQKKKFREGMLIQTIQSTQTLHRVLDASLDEIKPFIWAGFVTSAAALAMASAQALASASIRPGDRVALTAGEYAGHRARVISCNDIVAVLDILDFDADNKVVYMPPFLWEEPIRHLRRSFYVEEKVYVREDVGEHAGSIGCVLAVDGDGQHLTFLEDQTGKHVSALSHLEANQRIHSNRSTSSAHLSRYTRLFINRLIFLNPDRPVSAHSLVDEFF